MREWLPHFIASILIAATVAAAVALASRPQLMPGDVEGSVA